MFPDVKGRLKPPDEEMPLARARRPMGSARNDPAAAVRRTIDNPAFQQLVRERTRFAWTLSIVMVAVYLAFILLVAFAHDLMATTIGGGPLSLGIVLGIAVIVFAFVLTGIYVARANSRYDDLTRTITGGDR